MELAGGFAVMTPEKKSAKKKCKIDIFLSNNACKGFVFFIF